MAVKADVQWSTALPCRERRRETRSAAARGRGAISSGGRGSTLKSAGGLSPPLGFEWRRVEAIGCSRQPKWLNG